MNVKMNDWIHYRINQMNLISEMESTYYDGNKMKLGKILPLLETITKF